MTEDDTALTEAEQARIEADDAFIDEVEHSRRGQQLGRQWAMARAVETTVVQLRAANESVAFVTGEDARAQPVLVAAFLQALAINHAAVLGRGDYAHVGCNDDAKLPREFLEKLRWGFGPTTPNAPANGGV